MKNRIPVIMALLCTVALGASVTQNVSLNNFNAGELSPLMHARYDFPKYAKGAQTLENFLVRAQGPISRRPGTRYIASAKHTGENVRLVPFDSNEAFIIELGDVYARFYHDGAQVLNGADPYDINTPFDESDLFELQYAQTGETIRFVHPDYEPWKLTRISDANWTGSYIDSTTGPFLKENTNEAWTLDPNATTGDVNIVSSMDLFNDDHVGALFQLRHLSEATLVKGDFGPGGVPEDANSANLTVQKYRFVDLRTGGEWRGIIEVQRSYDDGVTWSVVFADQAFYRENFSWTTQELNNNALYRVHFEEVRTPRRSDGMNYKLLAREFWVNGVIEITDVNSATIAKGTVQVDLASHDATYRWAEFYWSDYRGWPRTIEHHEERIIYGGSNSYPNTLWSSVIATTDDEYDDFTANIEADYDGLLGGPDNIAWIYKLSGNYKIQWLKSREYLMVGTSVGIGRFGQPDKPLTPNFTPTFRMQAMNGAAYMQPVTAADAVLYLEKGGQKIRELTYTFASERYVAPDMTILAEHITGKGIVQMDFQERPEPIL